MPNVASPTPRFELTLMRHAKALPAKAGESDHARALDPLRGPFEAREAAIAAAGAGVRPQIALISTARRTVETWQAIADLFPGCAPHYLSHLYHANTPLLARIISSDFDAAERLLVIGHNPGLQEFAQQISRNATETPTQHLWVESHFPTAAIWSCRLIQVDMLFTNAIPVFSFLRSV